MLNIKEIISKPEYKWLDEYKDRLCFLVISGSHGYGTNVEGSDVDIRGVMLPTKDELIGLKTFKQREDSTTDTTIYEFNQFIKLAMANNPNVIEMLGFKHYLIFNEIGYELLDSLPLLLSKKCYQTFNGYAVAQLRKIENALATTEYTEEEKAKHIKQTMDVAMMKLSESNKLFADGCINVTADLDKLYIDCNIKHAPIDLVRSSLNDILTIEKSYNKINQRNTKPTIEKLNKHCMHLFRLIITCCEILEKGVLNSYREDDRDFLLDIRNGKFIKDGYLTAEFTNTLNGLNKRLQLAERHSTLQKTPNYDELNKFVTDVNSKVITDTVLKYEEPLEEIIIN